MTRAPNRRACAAHIGCAFVATLALSLVSVEGSPAQTIESLNGKLDAARAEAGALAAEVEEATDSLAAARARVAESRAREASLTALLAGGREREARLARRAGAAEEQLGDTRRRLRRAVDSLAARIVAVYKAGELDGLALLLDADGYDDLLTRSEYLRRVEEADAGLVGRVRELRDDVEDRVEALRTARDAAARLNERLDHARRRVGGVRERAETDERRALGARTSQARALASLRKDVGRWTREVERIEQTSTPEAQGEVISWFGDWAIPQAIVMCESGGNYSALNPSSGAGGAYQILPSTWKAYGGKGSPHEASKTEQDRIAALIWRDSGPSAWVCAG